MSLRLSQSFCSCGSAKQVYILAIAWPLSTVSVATTASFASPWQWSPVQAKMSQKPWCWLTHVSHSTLLLRKPVRICMSGSLQKNRRGQRRSGPSCSGMCGTTWSWGQATLLQPLFHVFLWWHVQVEFLKIGCNTDDIDAAETLFLPSGSLQSLAFSFLNFREKLYLGDGEGVDVLGIF